MTNLNEQPSAGNGRRGLSGDELQRRAHERRERGELLVHPLPFLGRRDGYVRKGWSHLLSAKPKAGKTELLVSAVSEWRGETVLWLTEEPEEIWMARLDQWSQGSFHYVVFKDARGMGQDAIRQFIASGNETI